ncbi:FMN-dependent dehydrogenase [Thelonectria olida]|uniref:Oxidase FUB9 n=1 Tax=Thelonectria olida TaxID=1576542 RepID=A0A9P9AU84_9HYPO|nr:FMN-dependent dehydrogenase [Thelonectria olida]
MAKPIVHSLDELEEHATQHLPRMVRDYFNGGSQDSITLRANRRAYQDWFIQPRVLRDVSSVDTKTRLFPDGNQVPFPCCIAPAAMQRMAHPDGELATARACGAFGTVMGLSTFATASIEDVKAAADEARRGAGLAGPSECVLQMYLFSNRETSKALIRRAEAAGYKAIVLTVDTPFFGRRLTEIRNRFRLPSHFKLANFDASLGVKTGSEHRTDEIQGEAETDKGPVNKLDASLTWEAVTYLKSITQLPIWVKGIMAPQDAALAIAHGADAVFVSNHGGRQLDGAPPTLRVLESICQVVKGRVPVHFDGGVRRGSDIFKALCLGADMVWIGRPALWAIAYDGERGLMNALKVLQDEFAACMALAGCARLGDLGPEVLMRSDSRL